MGVWRQIGEYLWVIKKDPDRPHSQMTSAMHFINRLSILLFLLAMIILIIQLIRRYEKDKIKITFIPSFTALQNHKYFPPRF